MVTCFLNWGYYVGLLTAAMYHGAAHQQPQRQFIVNEPPYLRPIKNRSQSIVFCLKKEWSAKDVEQQKTDAGYINISSPSLTALDLVFYEKGPFCRRHPIGAFVVRFLWANKENEQDRRIKRRITK